MCEIIEARLSNGEIIEFEGSTCNCVLGIPGAKVNEEFAKWFKEVYQKAREVEKSDKWNPELIITVF